MRLVRKFQDMGYFPQFLILIGIEIHRFRILIVTSILGYRDAHMGESVQDYS